MRGRAAAWILAVASVACASALARLAALAGTRGLELGRAHVTSLDPRIGERLARGDVDLLVQWFGPSEADRPAGYDEVESRVQDAFDALERAAPGRVHAQILRPDADPEVRRHAELLGLAPFRARRIVRDGWTDVPVWSALRVVVAGRGASVVRALTPDLAAGTQELVAAAIAEIETPRRSRIALSAPPGHTRLRALLRDIGDVGEVDFDLDAELPADSDLFVWIAPARADAAQRERLREFVDRGGSVFLAADRFRGRVEGADLVLESRNEPTRALFEGLGLAIDDAPLLEAPPPEVDGPATDWAWHVVRSIGSRQDFRAFAAQPNGTLAFQVPAAFSPDLDRLRRNASTFTSIATSSDRCFELPSGTQRVRIADFASGDLGRAQPPRTLVALLRPDDSTHGSVVVAASASPFGDAGLSDPAFVHADLVRVVVHTLASAERRALAAVARARPAPLPEATNAERWTARALCIALVPLALLAIGLARGALVLRDFTGPGVVLPALALAAALLVGIATLGIGTSAGFDWSRASTHALAPESIAVAGEAGRAGASITAAFSSPGALPPELRPSARELIDRCERLSRAAPGLSFRQLAPDALDDAARAALGIHRLERTSRIEDALASQTFFASVVVELGTHRRVLDFWDAAAFEHADFRLALALRDVTSGARTRIAVASEPARVTPAEAHELYQKHKLFAPGTGDPFSAARALLEQNGFEVRLVDPTRPPIESAGDSALFVWFQPRRDATPGMRYLATHLARGGSAVVAAQQHRIRPRLRSDRAGDASSWPEPLFPDIDRPWLAAIGVQMAPELVLDAQSGVLRTTGTRELDGRVESVTMDLASPLVVRSTPSDRPATAFTAGVGDVLLPSPTRIALDAAVLAREHLVATPILTTSARAWTAPWSGGDVPSSAYAAPDRDAEPLLLGVRIAGRFPGPGADPALGAAESEPPAAGGARAGRLVLFGASEPFTDANLATESGDAARLLLQTCAVLTLPPEYAAILARRPTVGGYRVLEPGERLRARVVATAAGPLLVLALAFAWRARRNSRRSRELGRELAPGVA